MPFDFNPAKGLARMGFQSADGLLPTAWQDHTFLSESLSMRRKTIQLQSITDAAQTAQGLPGPATVAGEMEFEFDAEGHARFVAAIQGASATPTNPATGVYVHRLAPDETDVIMPSSIAQLISRDDGEPQAFVNGKVDQLELSITRGNALKGKVRMIYERTHYFDDYEASVDGATPLSVAPQIRGIPRLALRETDAATGGDVYVQVQSIAGMPTSFTAKAKVGTGGAYGTATFVVTLGVWSEIKSDGVRIGTRDIPVELFVAVGTTGIEANDVFKFGRDRALWVPSPPDILPMNPVFANLVFNDGTLCVSNLTLTIPYPARARECATGVFPQGVLRRGQRAPTVKFEREPLDLEIRHRIEAGERFEVVLETYTGTEFETGYEHSAIFTLPRMVADDLATYSIKGRDSMPENVEATAHPDPGNGDGYFADCTVEITNSIPDLTVQA